MRNNNFLHNMKKSYRDKILFGVCGGLGEHTPIPSWVWRVIFIVSLFCGGIGIIIYILLALFMPIE
ncbi:MAG TPA: PspC domain-containing protein [Victivallales bacterium]|nr:PspC domain-containing protein [Victivallales bacterium]